MLLNVAGWVLRLGQLLRIAFLAPSWGELVAVDGCTLLLAALAWALGW